VDTHPPPPPADVVGPRRPPVETTTYRITARLVESRAEADQDIHLVVAGLTHPGTTMIVGFPAFTCTAGAPPALRRQMAGRSSSVRPRVRSAACHARGHRHITGVGFIDVPHATGAAPNGIELHPVVGFSSRDCG
jgi:hypothetical protein